MILPGGMEPGGGEVMNSLIVEIKSRRCSAGEIIAYMPTSPRSSSGTERVMVIPRLRTRVIASGKDMIPAATSPENSPRECPRK